MEATVQGVVCSHGDDPSQVGLHYSVRNHVTSASERLAAPGPRRDVAVHCETYVRSPAEEQRRTRWHSCRAGLCHLIASMPKLTEHAVLPDEMEHTDNHHGRLLVENHRFETRHPATVAIDGELHVQ